MATGHRASFVTVPIITVESAVPGVGLSCYSQFIAPVGDIHVSGTHITMIIIFMPWVLYLLVAPIDRKRIHLKSTSAC